MENSPERYPVIYGYFYSVIGSLCACHRDTNFLSFCLWLVHLFELFWFLKGHCHGNQKVEPISFVPLPFWNGLQYRNSDFRRFSRINFSALCTILVTFRPVSPEFTLWTITPFATIRQKLAYHAIYLRMSSTYRDLLFRFGRHIRGDDYPNIRLAVTQGTLL